MARMTLSIPPHVETRIQRLVREEKTTKAQVIRRALALYVRIYEAVHEGKIVGICTREGKVEREILLDL